MLRRHDGEAGLGAGLASVGLLGLGPRLEGWRARQIKLDTDPESRDHFVAFYRPLQTCCSAGGRCLRPRSESHKDSQNWPSVSDELINVTVQRYAPNLSPNPNHAESGLHSGCPAAPLRLPVPASNLNCNPNQVGSRLCSLRFRQRGRRWHVLPRHALC